MKRNVIRLTESDLHRVIKESVNQILNEIGYNKIRDAHKKMKELGQSERANTLAYNYDEHYKMKDNRPYDDKDSWWTIEPMVERGKIFVYQEFKDQNTNDRSYVYYVDNDMWKNNCVPRMDDRRFAIELAKYIKGINPESNFANKNCYIA